jgi:hypothetical protein
MSSHAHNDSLVATLDRWVNGRAVLRFEDGQELAIARRFLPKNVAEGEHLEIQIYTEEMAAAETEARAKAILKEILSG